MLFVSNSPEETKKFAKKILKENKNFNVFSLESELGGGKTTFVQSAAEFFFIKEKIKSPTFVIMRKYNIKSKNTKFKKLYHFDCYRVKNHKEILELGWKEIIENPQNLVFVEWGDKIKKILPKKVFRIRLQFLDEHKRKITIF